jgi:uncharacterized beta barrel domain-containing protein DUF5777
MIKCLIAGCLMLITASAFAQTANPATPVQPIPVGDVLLTLPSSHMPDAGTGELKFTHRFNQSVDQGGSLHTLFGLDSGANVGIGVSYVPFRDFQIAFLRSTSLETIDLSARYLLMQQARALPFSAALRGGVAWRPARNLQDRTSFYVQGIVSRQFGQRIELYAMPTYATKAGRAASGNSSAALFNHAFNVPVGVVVQVLPAFSLVGEVIPKNHDLPSNLHADIGWAVGLKKAIGGHLFEILLTNNNGMSADQYITSTFNASPFSNHDRRLGFNIERRFGKGAKR